MSVLDFGLINLVRGKLRKALWVCFIPVTAVGGAAQQPRPTSTRSPHGSLKMPCENCHTVTSWKPLRARIEFDHSKTRYPLRALHQGASCKQCHASLVFTNVGAKCADCHADIHRRQFGADCERCHTVRG